MKFTFTYLAEMLTIVRFGVVGIIATLVHMGGAGLLVGYQLAGVFSANLIAYLIAFWIAFSGHFFWTFQGRTDYRTAIQRYFVISASAFAINNILLIGLVRYGLLSEVTNVVLAAGVVPVISYITSRLWGFRQKKAD